MTDRLAQTVGLAESQLQESRQALDTEVYCALIQTSRRLISSLVELHPKSHKPGSRPLSPPFRKNLTSVLVYERTPGYSPGIQERSPGWDGCHD